MKFIRHLLALIAAAATLHLVGAAAYDLVITQYSTASTPSPVQRVFAPAVPGNITDVASFRSAIGVGDGNVTVSNITDLGAGVGNWLITPSSVNLATAVTDETGSGALVFGTSPTISGLTTTGNSTFGGSVSFTGSLNLGNATIPLASVSGLGTGVATALAQPLGTGVPGVAIDSNSNVTGLVAPSGTTLTIEPNGSNSSARPLSQVWNRRMAIENGTTTQLKWTFTGSSVAPMKWFEYANTLGRAVGGFNGYGFLTSGSNSGSPQGSTGLNPISSSGTITNNTTRHAVWWTGLTSTLGASGTITFGVTGSAFLFDSYKIYYIGKGGTPATLGVQIDAGAVTNIDTSLTSSNALGIYSGTTTAATHTITLSQVSGSPEYVSIEVWNSTSKGLRASGIFQGGLDLTLASATAWTNYTTYLQSALPDIITWEMKQGQWNQAALNSMLTAIVNGAPNSDVVLFGSTPDSSSDTAQILANTIIEKTARTYRATGLNAIYWDGFTPLQSYARMVALGWNGDGTHPAWQAEQFLASLWMRDMGLYLPIAGTLPFSVTAPQVVTPSAVFTSSYANYAGGSITPAGTITPSGDLDLTVAGNRGLFFTAGATAGISNYMRFTSPSMLFTATDPSSAMQFTASGGFIQFNNNINAIGVVTGANTSDSLSLSSGSFVALGGISAAKQVRVGGALKVSGNNTSNETSMAIIDFSGGASRIISYGNATVAGTFSILGITNNAGINQTLFTASGLAGAAIFGTPTNNSAATGYVGEYVSSTIASGSAVSLTTATAANVTSISLTAGDWDVEGNVNYTFGTATVTTISGGVTSTSATIPADGSEVYSGALLTAASATDSVTAPRKRFSLSGTTTVYLVARTTFSPGTAVAFGSITARRVR